MKKYFFKLVVIVFSLVFCSCKMDESSNRVFSLEGNTSRKIDSGTGSHDKSIQSKPFNFLPTSTTHQLIKHSYYALSYNEQAEQAEWVAYELKKDYIKNNNFKRPFFVADPKVKTGSADWRNYKKSGFDKGHLCPAGDMEFDQNAYNDTFFTSNIAPQNHEFNAGIWNRLEQKVRYWALRYDGVYVITGGVLGKSKNTIGKEKVQVPEFFYKIICDESNGNFKIIAFLIPHERSEKALYSYVVSVDSLEKMTGIDFFPQLEDRIENTLEKQSDYKSWIFN